VASTTASAPPATTATATTANVTATSTPEPSRFWSAPRIGAIVAGATGLVALGVGGVIALDAKSKDNTAAGEPGLARQTDSQSAVNEGNAATVIAAVGGALVATGIVLWIVSPKSNVTVGVAPGRAVLGGRF